MKISLALLAAAVGVANPARAAYSVRQLMPAGKVILTVPALTIPFEAAPAFSRASLRCAAEHTIGNSRYWRHDVDLAVAELAPRINRGGFLLSVNDRLLLMPASAAEITSVDGKIISAPRRDRDPRVFWIDPETGQKGAVHLSRVETVLQRAYTADVSHGKRVKMLERLFDNRRD